MKKNNYLTLSTAFWVLVKREIYRFLSLYKQTIIPGVISSALYIIVFERHSERQTARRTQTTMQEE